MPRQTEAEELIRLMRELGQLSEHEDTKLTTRGESALLTHLALGHNGATAGELRQALEVGSSRVNLVLDELGEKDSAEYLRLTRKLIQAMAKVAGHAEPA